MPEIAKQADWKTEQMPNEVDILDLRRDFSSQEFDRIKFGLIPRQMEDKWFIYYNSNVLNIHRSWTGHHIYKIFIEQENERYKVTRTVVNRNVKQYNQQDNDYDIMLVNRLIDRLLFQKDMSVVTPNTIDVAPNKNIRTGPGFKLQGCLVGGAIGDAVGSYYEGRANVKFIEFDVLDGITDDTQLTLATCEAIISSKSVSAESISSKMLEWYNKGKLSGLGSSTLKALRDLQVGAHWGLSGRSGEYAAGNGAAMRIAPIAFFIDVENDKMLIRDICNVTHKNDEAYSGCLSILYALNSIATDRWEPGQNLLDLIIPKIPDTSVRDNLLILQENPSMSISEAARLVGTSGHVIESVPFSIFAAQKIKERSFDNILSEIILCGGDTDTNASLAGQIMGTFIGLPGFSAKALATFNKIKECNYIIQVGFELVNMLNEK